MSFSDEQKQQLQAKLDPANVKKPTGQFGPKGDYIEGWHAISEANRIFGFDGWNYEIQSLIQACAPYQNEKKNHIVSYVCQIRVRAGEVIREDVGYGSGASKQIGDAHESATKEAVTDALKRALRTFGNPFGLALYDKSQANVGKPEPITLSKEKAREVFDQLVTEVQSKDSINTVDVFLKSQEAKEAYHSLPDDWKQSFGNEVTLHKENLTQTKVAAE